MAQGEEIDGTPSAPAPDEDDEPVSGQRDGEDMGTPTAPDDEDLQSPPLNVDELPAH